MRVSRLRAVIVPTTFISGVLALALVATVSAVAAGNDALPNAPSAQMQEQQSQQQANTAKTPAPGGLSTRVDYSKPKTHFPNPIAPYTSTYVPTPVLTNTPRIEQLLQNGEIRLSLSDAVALALENNLDLAIARYNLSIADTDILLAKAGSAIRGVNTGLVQGTVGGTGTGVTGGASGGGAGGTSTGAGGAGTGAGGIVTSTSSAGPSVEQLDPALGGTMQLEHAVFPLSNSVTTGTNVLRQNTATYNFAYSQGFVTGTDLSVGFNNNRQASSAPFNTLNPTLNSSFRATFRQHLLQGFGIDVNNRFIRIAKNNKRISDESFRDQVNTTVSQIENIYWDLVNAYEDVKAKERAVALAQRTVSDNQKQVQIGTLAPIEVVRAQSQLAAAQQDLIVSQTNLQLQQLLTKNALTRNLTDPVLATAPVIPTDTMNVQADEQVPNIEDLINRAVANRPDITEARIDLTNRNISRRATRNALLPTVDLVGFYGATALGGAQNPLNTCGAPGVTNPSCLPAGLVPARGYGDVFSRLFDSTAPDKGVALSLTIPLRNRAAQATQERSELEYRQAEMRLQQLQNTIGIQVRNDVYALQQNRARVDAAIKGRELAAQSLDAEQKKYALGASTTFNVLQAQRDLATSESNVVASMSAYEKSLVELDRVTANTLNRLGISLGDTAVGVVNGNPTVPYTAPRADINAIEPQQQPQKPQQMQPPPKQ